MTPKRTVTGYAKRLTLLTAASLLVLAAAPAHGQALDDKYWITLTGYWPSVDTSASVARPNAPGTEIDFEADLGLEKSEVVPAISGGARFGRFVVQGEYIGLQRSSTRTLSRTLVFNGVTYPVNASVESEFESNTYRGSVGYVFLRNAQGQLGASLGLHVTDFGLELNGQGSVGTGPGLTTQRSGRDFLAPLPTVGAFGTYEITPKVILNGRAEYLSLNIGDYDGGVFDAEASVAWRVNQTFQVGVGYRYVAFDLDVNKDNYTARVDYDFYGPTLFLRLGFR